LGHHNDHGSHDGEEGLDGDHDCEKKEDELIVGGVVVLDAQESEAESKTLVVEEGGEKGNLIYAWRIRAQGRR
jgi:hypothetical protein